MINRKEYIKYFLLSLALFEFGIVLGVFIQNGAVVFLNHSWYNELIAELDRDAFFKQMLLFLIVSPVIEEFVFRKLLLHRLMAFGKWPAIIISSVLFSVAHWNIVQSTGAFLLGLVLGAVYCKTGKVRDTILLHFGINLVNGIIVPLIIMFY